MTCHLSLGPGRFTATQQTRHLPPVPFPSGFLFSFAFQEAFSIKWLKLKATTTKKQD